MKEDACQVIKRFPEHEEKIERLFHSNEDFFDLCLDYGSCSALLHRCEMDPECSQALIEEFQALILLLENDVLVYLEGK